MKNKQFEKIYLLDHSKKQLFHFFDKTQSPYHFVNMDALQFDY